MSTLSNKVAIITGASSGIGRATAKIFAREGASLIVSGRRRTALDELVAEIEAEGGKVVAIDGDVRDEAHARALVEAATEKKKSSPQIPALKTRAILLSRPITDTPVCVAGEVGPVPGWFGETRAKSPGLRERRFSSGS
jgi:NAD(P)-dependent dehydrogenase (short-subunit alcohol dehydrogenase family)